MRRRLTHLAHELVAAQLRPGDKAIDATAGNGHDTCFLAAEVGPDGTVAAFDIQPRALADTAARLRARALEDRVRLRAAGHERMQALLPGDWRGRVGAVMFNLGYLPGGDTHRVTGAGTTLPALQQALQMLRPGGIVSVLAYRDHRGGADEMAAIERWLQRLDTGVTLRRFDSPGPVLLTLVRAEAAPTVGGKRVSAGGAART